MLVREADSHANTGRSSQRSASHATTMTRVRRCELPGNALLRRYHDAVSHADCYCIEIRESVPLHAFVEAFYTTALFEIERALLSRVAHRPSTDQEARQLALGTSDTFAAWRVEGRDLDQLLVKAGRTRSWFMVARDSEGAAAGTGTRLYFGSAVVPVVTAAGGARLGLAFHALLGFHALYSRALLRAAASRLERRRVGGAS